MCVRSNVGRVAGSSGAKEVFVRLPCQTRVSCFGVACQKKEQMRDYTHAILLVAGDLDGHPKYSPDKALSLVDTREVTL